MHVIVEPRDGRELDRTITALLNATGTVHRLLEEIQMRPYGDPVEVIDEAAERLRAMLARFAEHTSDEQLALVTQLLAETALLIACELNLEWPPG